MQIPFLNPNLNEQDIKQAVRVMRSGWLTYGPDLKKFEKEFGKYIGAKHVIADTSGTAALHTAVLAAGIGKGDEVITTPLSYWATSNAILYVGAKPVFVDVESDTGLIDISKIEEAITKKTKAIIPVHLHGQMVDMKKLARIAKRHKLKIIEDAAHAIEAKRSGVKPGKLSFAACFSFHAAKNITAGEGGAVSVNDKKVAEKIKLYNSAGSDKSGSIRRMVLLGYKYDITNFQGALLLNQMKRIDSNWKKRKVIYERYEREFSNVEGVRFPKTNRGVKHAYHMFVIIVDPKKRNKIRAKLAERGVQTSVHYDPIHLEPYYKKTFKYKKGKFPIAERMGFGTITLPLYPTLSKKQQDYVIKTLKRSL